MFIVLKSAPVPVLGARVKYEYPSTSTRALFKITNIHLIFYECLEQFFGCNESTIDEHFLRVIDHAK